MSGEIILDDMDYNRISFDNGGIQCECPGYMPGLGGLPCNRPAHPISGFCAGCSATGCWCSCADCDPSSSGTSETRDDDLSEAETATQGSDTTVSNSGVAGGGGLGEGEAGGGTAPFVCHSGVQPPLCMPCGPQPGLPPGPLPADIVQPLCICIHGHGDFLLCCVHRAIPGSSYCEDCTATTCGCICIHCDPHPGLCVSDHEADFIDDYDIDGRVYFNPNNRQGIDPPRCACSLGDGRCEFEATREGFCDRCFARRCMCPCRGCDPDDFA